MPIPRTTVSDCRQIAEQWHKTFMSNVVRMMGRSKSWNSVAKKWLSAYKRLKDTKLGAHETYDDNAGFWRAIYSVASEISSLDYTLEPTEVLVWAFTDTVKDHAETVYNAGRSAVNAAAGVAGAAGDLIGAIPVVAKALAVGAVGLGVYVIAKR